MHTRAIHLFFFFFSPFYSRTGKRPFFLKYAKALFHFHLICLVIENVLPDTVAQ